MLHSDDYVRDGTLQISGGIALTATVDVLKAMIRGDGPPQQPAGPRLCRVGARSTRCRNPETTAGWSVTRTPNSSSNSDLDGKWTGALTKLGIDPAMLATDVGGTGKPN